MCVILFTLYFYYIFCFVYHSQCRTCMFGVLENFNKDFQVLNSLQMTAQQKVFMEFFKVRLRAWN